MKYVYILIKFEYFKETVFVKKKKNIKIKRI